MNAGEHRFGIIKCSCDVAHVGHGVFFNDVVFDLGPENIDNLVVPRGAVPNGMDDRKREFPFGEVLAVSLRLAHLAKNFVLEVLFIASRDIRLTALTRSQVRFR